MQDTVRLRAVIAEYDRLRNLDGGTLSRRVRGVRFNEFIADLFRGPNKVDQWACCPMRTVIMVVDQQEG